MAAKEQRGFEDLDCYHSALRSLNGYIRYVRKQQQGIQEYGDRALHEYDSRHVDISQLPDED